MNTAPANTAGLISTDEEPSMAEDRVIPAASRARWGFSGTKNKIEVATTESGKAGLYEKGKAKPSESEGAVHNGGGEEKPKRASRKKSEDTDTES